MCGHGATSEGDFHVARNFAAVFHLPVVFLVQNNKYAIPVPLTHQSLLILDGEKCPSAPGRNFRVLGTPDSGNQGPAVVLLVAGHVVGRLAA